VLVCLVVFGRRYGRERVERLCGECLAPICVVILVTGAGGMFGGVLRASGIGAALSGAMSGTGLPVVVSAFLIAAALRIAQGSATVALTTTAALIAPMTMDVATMSALDRCFVVIAIAGGATVLSHFNDSGFWLVGRCFGMDERTTLRTWTVMVTLLGSLAFAFACLGSWLF
jgi:GntP family gluconate:H+ symporter